MHMEYRILTGRTTSELELEVMQFISLGWRPLGGVSVAKARTPVGASDVRHLIYAQAMTRDQSDV